MSILVPYRWARSFGLSKAQAYKVARRMALTRGTFTGSMIAEGIWTDYKVWA